MSHSFVFACETQPIVAEGLERVLGRTDDLRLVGQTDQLHVARLQILQTQSNIVLLDAALGVEAVLEFIADWRSVDQAPRLVFWSDRLEPAQAFRAFQLGASGVLARTEPVETLLTCLRSVSNGKLWSEAPAPEQVFEYLAGRMKPRLTVRERDVLSLVCQGLKNREIGKALTITPGTVKVHMMHLFEKTGTNDRQELALQGRAFLDVDPVLERRS